MAQALLEVYKRTSHAICGILYIVSDSGNDCVTILLRTVAAARTAAFLCCDPIRFAVTGSSCAVLYVGGAMMEDSPCDAWMSGAFF